MTFCPVRRLVFSCELAGILRLILVCDVILDRLVLLPAVI
jgi:hypothetical protein